ncbi:MAG: outer membrane protein transport protein [Bacteroidaceae bacterium]|nr:outer membrane protein transport protein [Bacteroidaceae bacterium]
MKKLFTTIIMAAFALTSFAGGLTTNTNQHSAFVRNPARFATLGIDGVYFNPAGTAFLQEGWHLSANWQMVWQDRDAIDLKQNNKKYEGNVYVPCMPTILAAYKTGDWTFSGFFGMPGGGGKAEFDNGLPLFDNLIGGLGAGLGAMAPVPMTISGASQFESTQYLFALQFGAAYKINDNLSAYAGIRGNYVSNNYMGTIKALADIPAMGATGVEVMAVNIDMDQSGVAFAPIVGVDYKIGDFNFAAKYEFRAKTTVENDTKACDVAAGPMMGQVGMKETIETAAGAALGGYLGGFADGNKLRSDAPAILSLAGSWQIIDRLQVMAGWNYYFDKDAKVESLMGGDNMKKLSRNTLEYLFGAEFKVTEKFLLSAGIQFSNFGINDNYTSDLAFTNDSFMTGVGGKYSLTEKLDINFGYCYANYAPDHNALTQTRYERKTHNATVGVDFRF